MTRSHWIAGLLDLWIVGIGGFFRRRAHSFTNPFIHQSLNPACHIRK
jgi:hypothetical protein